MYRHERYLQQNIAWIEEKQSKDPDYFRKLAKEQTPEILWIGCSDSRVPSSEVTQSELGEIFEHRNIANQANPADASFLSVIEFALDVLKIPQIIVCGHYGCGGVQAALEEPTGLQAVDSWLDGVRSLAEEHCEELDAISDPEQKANHLVELNIHEQIDLICQLDIVKKTWDKGQLLCLHGWVYDMPCGLLRDLEFNISGSDDVVLK
ncbi:MAG: carbonic anhydrase [Bdellovibrionales bacterium]|nr:carbonic anhydrase [Bdellovibrionales bacterium]